MEWTAIADKEEAAYIRNVLFRCDPQYKAWLVKVPRYWVNGYINRRLLASFSQQVALYEEANRKPFYAIAKRIFDFSAALVFLAVFSPLFLFSALAIKLGSPGPVFFKQLRIGFLGRPFWVYKFRTMEDGAEKKNHPFAKPLQKILSDDRTTAVGRLLRNRKIDELPQLINVLSGEMSLVGPRPLPIEESAGTPDRHMLRFAAVPGLTGLWQATRPNTIPGQRKIALDKLYVKRRSFLLDLRLLILTVGVVLRGENKI